MVKAVFTLAMISTISHAISQALIIVPYLLTLANRNDPISVSTPKVAKASTIVAVVCHCRWHYRLKYNPIVNYP